METIVVVGVMTALLLIITQIFIINYAIYEKQSSRSANETGAILAAKNISRMTRGAVNVEASHVFGSQTRTSSSAALVLRLPSVDASGNIIAGSYDHVAFYRHPTNTTEIYADIDGASGSYRLDTTRLITAYNQTLTFRYNAPAPTDASRVSLYVLNSQTKRGTTLVSRGWTSFFLRNQ